MKFVVSIVCVAIINMGMAGAASAAIVDTASMVTPDRAVDMGVVVRISSGRTCASRWRKWE